MRTVRYPVLSIALLVAATVPPPLSAADYAEIRVIDAQTRRGVPLVELETVNRDVFVTDNAGRVAFREPGLMGRELFLTVRGHGYEVPKDGFGFAGVRVTPKAGSVSEIVVKRKNVAERLCRLTGEGRYRDTRLLGLPVPLADSPHPGNVAGQDSVQAAVYRGKVFWFWGDTSRMNYPLGMFRTAGATTPVPDGDPSAGIAFDYFVNDTGFARPMIPYPKEPKGVIWIDGVCVVADDAGGEKLVAHYSRREGLGKEYEHGVAVFDDAKAVFEPARVLPPGERWRHPSGQAVAFEDGGTKWVLFGNPVPDVRVPATLAAVLDPKRYEALTCAYAAGPKAVADGRPDWRWQAELPPTSSVTESQWLKAGRLEPEHARMTPADAANPADRVTLHNGTVRWNAHRKCWVLIAGQIGGKPSHLGEVWYAEAAAPTGPFAKAVKVVTHDRQTFYNVCQHPFLDRDGGRVVHFEGTYTADFSGNSHRTPRYEYNQVLYRLDLDAPKLAAARP